MTCTNFEMSMVSVISPEGTFDLHNCYNFTGFEYSIRDRRLTLRWVPGEHASASDSLPITLVFAEVTHFAATPRDPERPFTEDDCFSGFGWKGEDTGFEVGVIFGCIPPEESTYVLEFMSGLALEIRAATATLHRG